MGMKQKRFKIETKFVGDHECQQWKVIKWFNDFEVAKQYCDHYFNKVKGHRIGFDTETFHYTRIIDTTTNQRVYPYQKDKTGKEIIPKF